MTVDNSTEQKKSNSVVLYVTIGLVVVFILLFAVAFLAGSQPGIEVPDVLTEETYMEDVALLLADADPVRGGKLAEESYECFVCHVEGAGRLAPDFVNIAGRAAVERLPLTAEAYLYESLFAPAAHIVEGDYQGVMPTNYRARINDEDAGDVIAYMLTLDEEAESEPESDSAEATEEAASE